MVYEMNYGEIILFFYHNYSICFPLLSRLFQMESPLLWNFTQIGVKFAAN